MRLVTFENNGKIRLGAVRGQDGRQEMVDLNQAEPRLPADMLAFLTAGEPARRLAEQVIASTSHAVDLSTVALKAPVLRPGKIICIGLNYRDHAEETGQAIPDYPLFSPNMPKAVLGSWAAHRHSTRLGQGGL